MLECKNIPIVITKDLVRNAQKTQLRLRDAPLQENSNSCTEVTINHPTVILDRGRMFSPRSLSSAIRTRFLSRIIIAQHSVELVLSSGWTLLDNTAQTVQKCQSENPRNNTELTHQATPMKIYPCDSGCGHTIYMMTDTNLLVLH